MPLKGIKLSCKFHQKKLCSAISEKKPEICLFFENWICVFSGNSIAKERRCHSLEASNSSLKIFFWSLKNSLKHILVMVHFNSWRWRMSHFCAAKFFYVVDLFFCWCFFISSHLCYLSPVKTSFHAFVPNRDKKRCYSQILGNSTKEKHSKQASLFCIE